MATTIAQQSLPAALPRHPLIRLSHVLCSRALVAVLLAALLGLCVLGVIIPQRGSPSHASWEAERPTLARLAAWSGLDHAFTSWPFLALVCFAGLSVTVSVAARLRGVLARSDTGRLGALLARRRLLGSLLFHAGLVGILVGGTLSTLTRSEGRVLLTEGQEITLHEAQLQSARAPRINMGASAPFQLRLDRFHPVHEGSWGTPDYASDLTVFEGGREARRVTVRVNEPLAHNGVTLYQSVHGFSTLVVLTDAAGRPKFGSWVALGTDLKSDPVRYRDQFTIPGTRLAVEAELFPDACMRGGQLASRSPDPRNPALAVTVREGVNTLYRGPLYSGKPVELGDDLRLRLAGVRYWCGFDTVRDRGTGALLASAWVAVAGLCVRFWPRRHGARDAAGRPVGGGCAT